MLRLLLQKPPRTYHQASGLGSPPGPPRHRFLILLPPLSFLFLCFLLSLPLPATAQNPCAGNISWTPGANGEDQDINCANFARCYPPVLAEPTWTPANGCNPNLGNCSFTIQAPVEFPGNHQNDPGTVGGGYSFAQVLVLNSGGGVHGQCGAAGQPIVASTGIVSWGYTGSCSSTTASFQVTATSCPCFGPTCPLCPKAETMTVALRDSGLCDKPPPDPCPKGTNQCELCLTAGGPPGGSGPPAGGFGGEGRVAGAGGGGGNGGRAGGGGGASVGGGGGGWGAGPGAPSGPGARLSYFAGGAGGPGWPGTSAWLTRLGRYWSHDYAERIVPDPDDSHVWLITRLGGFHEFSGLAGGVYGTNSPTDEYRTLRKVGAGWTLTDLDGTVQTFGSSGEWLSTADRFGNTKSATYGVGGELERVDFPDGRSETFAYDAMSSKLERITEVGVGGSPTRDWTYTWTGDDLERIDLPDGRAWELFYEATNWPGYLTRVELVGTAGARQVDAAWLYDTAGNVVALWSGDASMTGPNAVDVWQLSFDDPGLPVETTVTDPLGATSTYTIGRDDGSRKARLEDLSGSCPACSIGPNTTLTYGDTNHPLRPTRETDARGIHTYFTYDSHGQVLTRTEASGTALERTTNWTYDPTYPALVTEIEQPSVAGGASTRSTVMTYDSNGALTQRQITGTEAPGGAFVYSTTYVPTAQGQTATIDPPGYGSADQTTFIYDPARGGLVPTSRTDPLVGTTTFDYDPFNRRTSVTDPNGVITTTEYDAAAGVVFVTQVGASPAENLVTEYRYDELGRLFQTILPRGNVLEYAYDVAGRLLSIERKPDDQPGSHGERTVYQLDAAGNRTREEQQVWDGALWQTRTFTDFEWLNRCQMQASVNPNGSRTEYAYDCEGNLEKVWDANHPSAGQTEIPSTFYVYDELSRLEEVRQRWGGAGGGLATTAYEYDVQDHLTSVTDAELNTTSYVYSDRDLLTQEVSPVSGTTSHVYNEHGELTQTTDARGVTVARTIDELDRVTLTGYPDDTLDVAYTYDDPLVPFSKGRLTAIARDGSSVDYAYDRFGRVTQDGALGYQYDANGNRIAIEYPGSVTAVSDFDYADRPTSLTVQRPGEPDLLVADGATYEPSGPLVALDLGNGLTETRPYTDRYFPSAISVDPTAPLTGSPVLQWTYGTDNVGNILSIDDVLTPANDKVYTYQDFQYFLTGGTGPWGTLSWTYDQIGNRLTETRDGTTDTYAYTPNAGSGNTALLSTITLGLGGTRGYTYGPAGHLEQVNAPGNAVSFLSDAAGRLTRLERPAGDAQSDFLYDGRSFLRWAEASSYSNLFTDGFETGDGSCWTLAEGSDINAGTATCARGPQLDAVYSSEGLLHAVTHRPQTGPETTRYYLYLAGRPVAQLDVDAAGIAIPTWLTTDHLGTPVLATDAAGTALWQGGFEPFGADYSGAGAAGVDLRFPGQWEDGLWGDASAGAGVVYNVHRWYELGSGRYTKVDPDFLVDPTKQLPFTYSRSSPVLWTDSLGRWVDMDDELVPYVACALRPGSEFAVAWNWMLGERTRWVVQVGTEENSRGHFREPPGGGSNWDKPGFLFKPGYIRIDTRDPSCETVVDGLAAEIIEAYAWGGLDIPTDGSPWHPGQADRHAARFRDDTVRRSCTCQCKSLLGLP